jgi:Toprim-like/Protein of unknown function (DUF3991)
VNCEDLHHRAAVVREVALETVLILCGAERDQHDKSKWHTAQGTVSVTGAKFTNWQRSEGGGGAIDLVMHLTDVDFRTALAWLEHHLGMGHLAAGQATNSLHKKCEASDGDSTLRLPVRDDQKLRGVIDYLTRRRHIALSLLEPLCECGKLYADQRGNAVFLLVTGKANRPVGAELRGSGMKIWRGMAAGTRKDLGYFWVGGSSTKEVVLCESAIDAISCYQLHRNRICISTSGVRPNPKWLSTLIYHGYKIQCGFDADDAGDTAARQMIALHPIVKRLRPPAHDWNDVIASRS